MQLLGFLDLLLHTCPVALMKSLTLYCLFYPLLTSGPMAPLMKALLTVFETGWHKFAKTGPADGCFNKWWNASCAQAKAQFNEHPCMHTKLAFQAACKAAKKTYFVHKLEDMVKHRKPWLGTHWIKDWPIPKVPQIQTTQGHTINELQPMFDAFQSQFHVMNVVTHNNAHTNTTRST